MKSKIKYILMMVFSFLFFFSFTNSVSAKETTVEYDTYILKYDYSMLSNDGQDLTTYRNKTYVMDFPTNLAGIDYVTYYVNVKNVGSTTVNYGLGTYAIRDGVATTSKIRFEDTLNSGDVTYFVIKNHDVNTVEEFMASLISVDFFQSMVDSLNSFLGSELQFAYLETDGALISGYEEVYGFDGLKYSYYTTDGLSGYDKYSTGELESLDVENGYVFHNTSLTRLSDMYTITDLENAEKKGYDLGFADGEVSVDITSDNDTVIDIYIEENGLLTKEEGESLYQSGINDGKEYVYGNIETDVTINEYISNNYYTKTDIDLSYELGVDDGKNSIYLNLNTDKVVNEYVNTQVEKTIVENTSINVVDQHNHENVFVIKKYDVDYSDTGDFTINVYRGQDNYIIDTEFVENTTTTVDYDLVKKIVFYAIVLIAVIVAFSLIGMGMSTPKKEKRRGYYAK